MAVLSILDQPDQIIRDGRHRILPDAHAELIIPDVILLESFDQPLRNKRPLGLGDPIVGKYRVNVLAPNRLGLLAKLHQTLNRPPRQHGLAGLKLVVGEFVALENALNPPPQGFVLIPENSLAIVLERIFLQGPADRSADLPIVDLNLHMRCRTFLWLALHNDRALFVLADIHLALLAKIKNGDGNIQQWVGQMISSLHRCRQPGLSLDHLRRKVAQRINLHTRGPKRPHVQTWWKFDLEFHSIER